METVILGTLSSTLIAGGSFVLGVLHERRRRRRTGENALIASRAYDKGWRDAMASVGVCTSGCDRSAHGGGGSRAREDGTQRQRPRRGAALMVTMLVLAWLVVAALVGLTWRFMPHNGGTE